MTAISKLPFDYRIKTSKRATRTRIKVTPGQVDVIVPHGVAESQVLVFLRAKRQWVLDALERLQAEAPERRSFAPAVYGHGAEIPYRGQRYPLSVRPTHLKRVKIEFDQGFTASVPDALPADRHHDEIRAALIRWLAKETRTEVDRYVSKHADKHRLQPRSIRIKTQKSRWGSCGVHNDVHINWLLMLAPPAVLEYVVVHELCHIKVRNHSAAFWQLVAEHLPDYRERRQWLKQHGGRLIRGL